MSSLVLFYCLCIRKDNKHIKEKKKIDKKIQRYNTVVACQPERVKREGSRVISPLLKLTKNILKIMFYFFL